MNAEKTFKTFLRVTINIECAKESSANIGYTLSPNVNQETFPFSPKLNQDSNQRQQQNV